MDRMEELQVQLNSGGGSLEERMALKDELRELQSLETESTTIVNDTESMCDLDEGCLMCGS